MSYYFHVVSIKRRVVGSALLLLLMCVPATQVFAAGAISQSYKTKSNDITAGAILSLTATDTTTVELANATNSANLVGVAADKPLIALGNGQGTVSTVIGGTTNVLVSDLNGEVNAGDKIAISPISGIGMKAVESGQIVGTAQTSLSSIALIQEVVKGQDNADVHLKVGLLPVTINIMYYSPGGNSEGKAASFIPAFLQNIANGIAGKEVAPMRVLLSTIALLLGFIAAMVILYAAISNGVKSLGRNPLAASALRKELYGVAAAAVGVLALTAAVVYIVLVG